MVELATSPVPILGYWRLVSRGFLKGPKTATRLDIDRRAGRDSGIADARIGRSRFNPLADIGNDRFRQPLLLGRHF
jgi:hypothetical protein